MRRFTFLRLLGIGAAAAVIAPQIALPPVAEVETVNVAAATGEELISSGVVNSSMWFRAQSKALERVYAKSMGY